MGESDGGVAPGRTKERGKREQSSSGSEAGERVSFGRSAPIQKVTCGQAGANGKGEGGEEPESSSPE
jgi:hypothetical protein